MNSRVRALLAALIVLACGWAAAPQAVAAQIPGVAGVESAANHAGSRLPGPPAAAALPATWTVAQAAVDHSSRIDHEQQGSNQQRPDARDRIAKPIAIVAGLMFAGLVLLLLTARFIVRRRTQHLAAQR